MLRFMLYTLAIFSLTASLPYIIEDGDISSFQEGGAVEWLQTFILLSVAIVFLYAYFAIPSSRPLCQILACLSAFAAIREQDAALDDLIPVVSWKVGVIFLFYASYLAYRDRNELKPLVHTFLTSRAFALLWAAFVVAVPFSQLVGHGKFLQTLMGEDYIRAYKRVIEESGELVGYFLLLTGSLEFLVGMKENGRKDNDIT